MSNVIPSVLFYFSFSPQLQLLRFASKITICSNWRCSVTRNVKNTNKNQLVVPTYLPTDKLRNSHNSSAVAFSRMVKEDFESLKGKVVAVTGGGGYVGLRLIQQLLLLDVQVS